MKEERREKNEGDEMREVSEMNQNKGRKGDDERRKEGKGRKTDGCK